MTGAPVCSICKKPYTPRRKWNGGRPVNVWLSDCSCEDEKFLDEWLARRQL